MSCNVKNVIYIMKCRGCGDEYIGETGTFLRKQITVHNQHIRDKKTRMLKVSEHIDNCTNTLEWKYNIFPFYKMYKESVTLRRTKEKLFINTLQPKLNRAIYRDVYHQSIHTPETSFIQSRNINYDITFHC